jgi:hypothetical protein
MGGIRWKQWFTAVLGISLVFALQASRWSQQLRAESKPAEPPPSLKVGDTAPDFSLLSFDGKDLKKFSLSQYRGKKNVALAFYVFAFTGG